ncbi:MAG: calcium-translocating P-type ATPase, PMCA-type [Patescibacteria group bacterium]|nr:calcium-translocating P-type ATPase, PMCA-type [Patescibacteria group bacterium]
MEKGLTSKQAGEALKIYGANEIVVKKQLTVFYLFVSQFYGLINLILVIAAVFSFVIKDNLDGSFIVIVLFINAILGFAQKYKAEKSLQKLKNYATPLSRVIRDGKEIQIKTVDLVPKDLVVLSEGDRIPADGTIVMNHHLEVDESILTGESLPVIKQDGQEIFSGTMITKGRTQMIVEKTGINTKFGQIANTLSSLKSDRPPLETRLDNLAKFLSFFAIIASIFLIPIGIYQQKPLFPIILLTISIAVAAIPEGLPTVVTIALSIGTSRMAKKNAIVRKMQSVETLGAVQIILVDKTGTLTQNSMKVKKHWVKNENNIPNFLKACVLGNTSSLIQKEDTGSFEIAGDKTDGALLLFANDITKNNIDEVKDGGRIIDEYVFDPSTKTITTVWETDGKKYVFVRGAPDTILRNSKNSVSEKEEIKKLADQYASEGLRIIGFASKHEDNYREDIKREELEQNLNFVGLVGIYDPPRHEVNQAIQKAKEAGIKTIMVTGDNELTATAIAKEVGLIEKEEEIITGEELSKMSDDDIEKAILKTRIFARTRPEDKFRLVEILKKMGFVVAVTGDGVNDALALKRADVGIAMGQTGTDVAKETSDIVLSDDNFSTLVKAIEEGRVIYHNIVKSIIYLLSGNLSELSLVFFSLIFGLPIPLLPTQILWINLVTDGLPALALASDNKDPDLIKRSPRNPKEPILTNARIVFILIVGFSISFILFLVFKQLLASNYSETLSRTIIFNLLIFTHLFLTFVVRGKNALSVNKFLFFSIVATVILQVVITFTPFFQEIFDLGV